MTRHHHSPTALATANLTLSPSSTPWRTGLAILAGAVLLSIAVVRASETVPAAINYQGKLTDNLGNAVKSGYYEILFRIWNDPTKSDSANYIWGRTFPLHVVTNGMFNVLLTNDGTTYGSPTAVSILDAFTGTERYLGLTIMRNPDTTVTSPVEITPRQKLATAPYAIHAHQATSADHATSADNATQAASASSAVTATNALKFDSMSTTDFLKVKQTSQTLTGSLTITNGSLTVRSFITAYDTLHAAGPSVFDGTIIMNTGPSVTGNVYVTGQVTATDAVNANGGLKVSGNVRVAGEAPYRIVRFHLPNISKDNHGPYWHDTKYSTATYSAVFVGVNCTGDFEESGSGKLLQMMLYPNGNGNNGSGTTSWRIYFGVRHADNDLTDIYVDVMFIRNELTNDDRATKTYDLTATAN